MLTTGLGKFLVAYPMPGWLAFEEKLGALPEFEEAVEHLRMHYVGNATDVEVDKLGRVLIPPHLRAYAELGRDVVWVGSIGHIRLWEKGRHASVSDSVLSDPEKVKAIARRLAELGL